MLLPSVAIVVPSYNEERDIGRLLDSLMKVNYPKKKLDIIVVDDGSTDRTSEIVSRYPVKLIKCEHGGPGHARNFGWKAAKSDIIIFLDSDMVVDPKYIKEMVKFFEDPKIAGAHHRELLLNEKSLISRLLYLRSVLSWKTTKLRVSRSYRKKILEEVKGIDPDYGYYDDQILGLKVLGKGYKIVEFPKAKAWHRAPETWKELWKQCKWSGKSMIFSFKGYRKEAFRRILFPLLCAALPVYLIFLLFPFLLRLLGLIGLAVFLYIEIKRSIEMFLISKQKVSFLTIPFDFISMSFTFIGMFMGIISRSRKL